MKQRLEYIDNAKAILIAMVVLAHILNYANPEYNIWPYTLTQAFITSFHMPAFFLLSGFLFNHEAWRERSWCEFVGRRLKTLLIPYVFFEVLAVLYLHFVLHRVSITEGMYRLLTFRCNVGADWFLPAMFLANIVFFASVKYPNHFFWPVAVALSLFCTWILPTGHWWKVLCRGLLGFSFLFMGNRAKKWLSIYKPSYGVIAFFLTAVLSALSQRFYSNDMYSAVLENPPLFAASGFAGLYFVLSISRLIQWKWLRKVGENTLPIMGTHQLVLYTVPSSSTIFWVAGMVFLMAAVEFPLILGFNRVCPTLVGKPEKVERPFR